MKEGDSVTISPNLGDLETANKPYPFGINTGMLNLCGRQAKITSVTLNCYDPLNYPDYPNLDGKLYYIDLDNGHWTWANIMFTESVGLRIVEEEL